MNFSFMSSQIDSKRLKLKYEGKYFGIIYWSVETDITKEYKTDLAEHLTDLGMVLDYVLSLIHI